MQMIKFTDIMDIKIGHAQDFNAATGCTVILCEKGAVAGVDVRGGAPGTRETDLLKPVNLVDKVHGVLLSGGSAFGLDAACGVMEYLEEKGIGFDVGYTKVPIVVGAVLFDLNCGDYKIRPDKKMGYEACCNAQNNECIEGSVGAGTGATVGKIRGVEYAMKGGIGTAAFKTKDLIVGAVVAVNCFGDVVDSESGKIIAGALWDDKKSFINTENVMIEGIIEKNNPFIGNTTIGVVVTNATLTKSQATKVASMAHNGYARAIRPVHTLYDGDTIFALSTGSVEADVNTVGVLAARAVEEAVKNGVKKANSLGGYISYKDLIK